MIVSREFCCLRCRRAASEGARREGCAAGGDGSNRRKLRKKRPDKKPPLSLFSLVVSWSWAVSECETQIRLSSLLLNAILAAMKALVIHAHYDDYEFTTAGTFELWRQKLGGKFRGRVVV